MIDVPLDAELSSVSDPHSSGISIEKEELQEFNGDKIDATHIKIMRKSKVRFIVHNYNIWVVYKHTGVI